MMAFTLPTPASSVRQSLNRSINTMWIGHLLGEGALAATSNANLVMFPMPAGVFGFGMAASILVGQSTGRRDLWWSYPLGSGASLLMAIAYYRFGGWRSMRMGGPQAPPDAEQRAGLHVPA